MPISANLSTHLLPLPQSMTNRKIKNLIQVQTFKRFKMGRTYKLKEMLQMNQTSREMK